MAGYCSEKDIDLMLHTSHVHVLYRVRQYQHNVCPADNCKVPDLTQAVQQGQGILGQTGSLEKKVKAFHIINLHNLRGRVLNGGVPHPYNLC